MELGQNREERGGGLWGGEELGRGAGGGQRGTYNVMNRGAGGDRN